MTPLASLRMVILALLAVLAGLLTGCGGQRSSSTASPPLAANGGVTPGSASAAPVATPEDLATQVARGKAVYDRTCIACHQPTGEGIPKVFPPLAGSDYLIANLDKIIHGVIHGQQGEMVVKGETYNMIMPPQMLNDQDTADVVTYVLNSFGNPGGRIDIERVKRLRAQAR